MENKKLTILITGGAGGLGQRITEHLFSQGHNVVVIDILKKGESEPGFLEKTCAYFECDLSETDELVACFNTILEKCGTIDVLINNAAIRKFRNLDAFDTGEIERNIKVDLLSGILLSRLCLPVMKKNNFGRIINISSISGFHGFGTGTLYTSSKRALIAFTESLGKELKNTNGAVTVNAICPDSFSRTDSSKLKMSNRITDSILSAVDSVMHSAKNGKIIRVFTFQHKLVESLRFISKAFYTLFS